MASVTLNVAPTITSGTVTVYPQANWPYGKDISGAPVGSSVTTGTVGTDGSVTLTGLTAATLYVAYQASPDRYVRFRVPTAAASTSSGAKATYEVPKGYLDSWDTAVASAGSSLVEAVVIGDSTTFGQTPTGGNGYSANNYSILTKLRSLSIAAGIADGGVGIRSYYDSASMNPVDNVDAYLQFTRTDTGVGTTSASNVVTDTSVLATDIGRKVTFTAGFGAAGFIGSVTAGVSFTVVTTAGGSTALNATSSTTTNVTITGDGFTDAGFLGNGPLGHYDATAANNTQTGFTTVIQGYGTTLRLNYLKLSTGGTFTYSVDGGATTPISCSIGTTQAAYVNITGLSPGVLHTVTITVTVAGNVTIWPEWVKANGLVWHKEGVPGQKLLTRIPSNGAAYSFGAGYGTTVVNNGLTNTPAGPRNLKLAVLNMMLNDQAQASSQTDAINKAQTAETAVGLFATLCKNQGIPGVVCIPALWYFTNSLLYAPLFRRSLVTAARAHGLAWIDFQVPVEPVTSASTYGATFGSQPHLNQAGYDAQATFLWNNLLSPTATR